MAKLPVPLVGDGPLVRCVDGKERPYVGLDAAASTGTLESVMERINEFVPSYSSVHRGAGYKSQISTQAYEAAREAALRFAGRASERDVAIICRNTTEAINHLVYRLGLSLNDTVVTTVVEHHANLLPWSRAAKCRFVECGRDGTFPVAAVVDELDKVPRPKLLAVTAASNITGWMPDIDEIVEAAHQRGIRVALDCAQLAPHRRLASKADFVAWSGHKMYAPFGAGVLVGPRDAFVAGDPFLAGGGAVDLVDLNEVVWTVPPEREEAGSPNVVGAVALHAAIDAVGQIGWNAIEAHDREISRLLRQGLSSIAKVRLLGPDLDQETLPVATFVVEGVPHGLVAARLSLEYAIGVRHGCFCAHPYLTRLLGLGQTEIDSFRREVRRGDRSRMPGAVRASAGVNTSADDVARLLEAVAQIASAGSEPVTYVQDAHTGDFYPEGVSPGWYPPQGTVARTCSPG